MSFYLKININGFSQIGKRLFDLKIKHKTGEAKQK